MARPRSKQRLIDRLAQLQQEASAFAADAKNERERIIANLAEEAAALALELEQLRSNKEK